MDISWRASPQLYVGPTGPETAAGRDGPLDRALEDARAAGYGGVEVSLSLLRTEEKAVRFAERLRELDLHVSALFTTLPPPAQLTAMLAVADRTATILDQPGALPLIVAAPSLHAPAPASLAGDLTLLAGSMPSRLSLAWHPHLPDFRDGRHPVDRMLAAAPPEVAMCLDLGWLLAAEQSPAAWIDGFRDRISAIHVRDRAGGTWTEAVGDGDLDLPGVRNALFRAGYAGWLTVELWFERATQVHRTVRQNADASASALRTVFGLASRR